jgi:hypothetical protein
MTLSLLLLSWLLLSWLLLPLLTRTLSAAALLLPALTTLAGLLLLLLARTRILLVRVLVRICHSRTPGGLVEAVQPQWANSGNPSELLGTPKRKMLTRRNVDASLGEQRTHRKPAHQFV